VVLVFAWVLVFIVGAQGGIGEISGGLWLLVLLSGLATGGSWLCFFRALQLGAVNKVVPIDKSSTILTMVLAFIFLAEPVGAVMLIGMGLMALGTWLMLEMENDAHTPSSKAWLFYAVAAAVFAALVAIIGRLGVAEMDATLWTALRTGVVIPLSFLMVCITGGVKKLGEISRRSGVFLVLSGVATGVSWLFFYHALAVGNASLVVPIDKLSIVLTMGFAAVFLGEKFSRRSVLGLALLTAGTLLPVVHSLV
ncbi:MAG: EamA family transporter, partial [Defluviitaleaceae bacterium]|nr:EamA family transporter [Defluviitaleaceae bacterium]